MTETDYKLNFLTRNEAAQELRKSSSLFYVYILAKPDQTPFYIGKGCYNRVFQHEAEARLNSISLSHKINVIRKIHREEKQIIYAFAGFFNDEREAFNLERELIHKIGRYDLGKGPLTNQTDGGEGPSNPSEESLGKRLASLGGESSDSERRTANEFFNSIQNKQNSVPVKPVSSWLNNARPLIISVKNIKPTNRMAKAIAASALANQVVLKTGVMIPRLLVINGIKFLIENGCGCEMIKAGLLKVPVQANSVLNEKMELTNLGFRFVRTEIGERRLIELGILEP